MGVSRAELQSMDRDELIEEIAGMDSRLSDMQVLVYETLMPRLNDLEETVDELEAENQRLRERLDGGGGKDQKVRAIVQFAVNARDGEAAMKLNATQIKGATGCSRRYAYDLMDDLPNQYDWFLTPDEMQQYGSLEIDNEGRRLGIDFEGVHSSGCPVNKFTTASQSEGGEN